MMSEVRFLLADQRELVKKFLLRAPASPEAGLVFAACKELGMTKTNIVGATILLLYLEESG